MFGTDVGPVPAWAGLLIFCMHRASHSLLIFSYRFPCLKNLQWCLFKRKSVNAVLCFSSQVTRICSCELCVSARFPRRTSNSRRTGAKAEKSHALISQVFVLYQVSVSQYLPSCLLRCSPTWQWLYPKTTCKFCVLLFGDYALKYGWLLRFTQWKQKLCSLWVQAQ